MVVKVIDKKQSVTMRSVVAVEVPLSKKTIRIEEDPDLEEVRVLIIGSPEEWIECVWSSIESVST